MALRYKNTTTATYEFHGVVFYPGDVREVDKPIQHSQFFPTTLPVTQDKVVSTSKKEKGSNPQSKSKSTILADSTEDTAENFNKEVDDGSDNNKRNQ